MSVSKRRTNYKIVACFIIYFVSWFVTLDNTKVDFTKARNWKTTNYFDVLFWKDFQSYSIEKSQNWKKVHFTIGLILHKRNQMLILCPYKTKTTKYKRNLF